MSALERRRTGIRQERFMRRVLSLAALGLTYLTCQQSAMADDGPHVISGIHPAAGAAASPSGSGLGGGLFEYLLTGKTNSAPRRYMRPAPYPEANLQAYAPTSADSVVGVYASPRPEYAALAPASETRLAAEPPAEFRRQEVDYATRERPGTLVIDTPNKFLYLVEPGGKAMRYGVGVGRPGFEWAGVKSVSRKAEWPDWTPPSDMMKRRPDLPAHMEGGPGNPLGARALYLGSSMYRIHGTNEPWTIGQSVSSGCIRMMNADVIDLYERVSVGAKVIVI
jgi:lipoprotein-anchoring transpeptidase ErfK/SrfK